MDLSIRSRKIISRVLYVQEDSVMYRHPNLHDPPHAALEHIDSHRGNDHPQQLQRLG
jgi:hypothetical protein